MRKAAYIRRACIFLLCHAHAKVARSCSPAARYGLCTGPRITVMLRVGGGPGGGGGLGLQAKRLWIRKLQCFYRNSVMLRLCLLLKPRGCTEKQGRWLGHENLASNLRPVAILSVHI